MAHDPKPQSDDAAWNAPVRGGLAEAEDRDETEQLIVTLAGFDGPLDLLLALARTHKLDLAEISVVALADQYLAYIAEAQRLKLSVAADFLVMAAWLTFLKSRLLIPKDEAPDDAVPPDELARRLAFRLARLNAMRDAGQALMKRQQLGQDVFARGQEEARQTLRTPVYRADIYDLLRAYAARCNRLAPKAHVVRQRVVWSIKDARKRLERMLGPLGDGNWVQLDLCLEQFMPPGPEARTALAASFGASLEMAREGKLELRQDGAFAPLYLRPGKRRESGG
jgi:segregation and condensation protein A